MSSSISRNPLALIKPLILCKWEAKRLPNFENYPGAVCCISHQIKYTSHEYAYNMGREKYFCVKKKNIF